MKKLYFLFFILFSFNVSAQLVQSKPSLNENSIVKDSTGFQYPYAIWKKLFQSGNYGMRTFVINGESPEFLIYELSEETKSKRMESIPKPRETSFFKTGNKLPNFKLTDLNGNKFNLKELAGKVVVLNFWFINCAPCRKEIPELNKMVLKYKDIPNVVFLGVALDTKSEIKDFLKTSPFLYNISENGKWLSAFYGVNSYPTHVVVDQQATILFHSTGLAQNTVYWVDKSIKGALSKAETESIQAK
ncbi:TlpA family protein disulfide reductase [Daejeonella oryzae]|uniref:TlpA family protein disulfide reductase n=1 Tax=Daejeonella oryzae TaxID=1122943 RepID=UPI000423FC47|nr:TlpA disulfide reductase family protein [Daejeonella oryzae]